MINQEQAELLARKKLQEYVNECECENLQDVQNALLKMMSVTGVSAMATQGQQTSVDMLQATAAFVARQRIKFRSSVVQ